MVAQNDPRVRLFELLATVLGLVSSGKRDATQVANVLQIVNDEPGFAIKLFGAFRRIWRTITIGGRSAAQMLVDLATAGCRVSDWAREIVGKSAFTTLASPTEVSLVRAKIRDLGFSDPNDLPTTPQVFARAKEFGLLLCPAEVGPHLAIQFTDQSVDDVVWIAMEPIADLGGYPDVFLVFRRGDARFLRADCADPDRDWRLESEVVFVSR